MKYLLRTKEKIGAETKTRSLQTTTLQTLGGATVKLIILLLLQEMIHRKEVKHHYDISFIIVDAAALSRGNVTFSKLHEVCFLLFCRVCSGA